MSVKKMIMCAGLCLPLASSVSIADIEFGILNATASPNPVPNTVGLYDVVMKQLVNCCGVVRVGTDTTTDSIRTIVVENNFSAPGGGTEDVDDLMHLYISDPGSVRAPLQWVDSIINGVPSRTRLRVVEFMIDGSVGNPNGTSTIQASEINDFNIGSDLHAAILVDNVTGSSTGSGTMSVKIDGDVVRGGVYQNDGIISLIRVGIEGGGGGDVVSESGFVPEFWSSNRIDSVVVYGDFEGRIGSNSRGFAGHPDVGSVVVDGQFIGSSAMTMNSLNSLKVGGDFDANITLTNGITGNVILNSSNTSALWDGVFNIGSASITTPILDDISSYYTELSYELGGGAMGLAPFNFHQRTSDPASGLSTDRDCNPFHTEQFTVSPLVDLDEVVISHYGPVYIDGTGDHFYIEFKSDIFTLPSGPQWVDVSDQFEVVSPNMNEGAAQRNIVIQPKSANKTGFEASGRWRITPVDGKVKCGSVAGNPNVQYDSGVVSGLLGNTTSGTQYDWYVFRVRQQPLLGMTVLDNGAGPSLNDLSTWLTNPYEVNADGETNTQDFVDMASEYTGN